MHRARNGFQPVRSRRWQARAAPRLARTAAGLAALLVLAGCDMGGFGAGLFGPWECESRTVTVTGTVLDAVTRNPIRGALVSVPGQSAVVTDAQGKFTISGSTDACLDNIQVDVWAEGYLPSAYWLWSGGETEIELYRHRPVTLVVSHGSGGDIAADLFVAAPYRHIRSLSAQLHADAPWTVDSVPRPAVLIATFRGDEAFPYLAASVHLSPTGGDTLRWQPESAWIDVAVSEEADVYVELPAWSLDGSIEGTVLHDLEWLSAPSVLHVAPGTYLINGYGERSCSCTRRVEVATGDTVRVQV